MEQFACAFLGTCVWTSKPFDKHIHDVYIYWFGISLTPFNYFHLNQLTNYPYISYKTRSVLKGLSIYTTVYSWVSWLRSTRVHHWVIPLKHIFRVCALVHCIWQSTSVLFPDRTVSINVCSLEKCHFLPTELTQSVK